MSLAIDFPQDTFDVVTTCQCFWYFDYAKAMPVIADVLKKDGKLLILYMAWLPFEDKIAGASEEYRVMVPFTKESWHGQNMPMSIFTTFILRRC